MVVVIVGDCVVFVVIGKYKVWRRRGRKGAGEGDGGLWCLYIFAKKKKETKINDDGDGGRDGGRDGDGDGDGKKTTAHIILTVSW